MDPGGNSKVETKIMWGRVLSARLLQDVANGKTKQTQNGLSSSPVLLPSI